MGEARSAGAGAERRTRGRRLVALGTAVLLLAGCTGGGEDPAAGPPQPADAASGPTDAASGPTDGLTGGGRDAPAATPRPPPATPLATVEGTIPGGFGEDAPATLELLDLRRSGDVVTLAFAVVVGGADRAAPQAQCLFADEVDTAPDAPASRCRSVSGVTLVDTENGNRHLVLREPRGACVCSSNIADVYAAGERYTFSASFAAPPEDVTTMSVLVPQFASVEDVPISDG